MLRHSVVRRYQLNIHVSHLHNELRRQIVEFVRRCKQVKLAWLNKKGELICALHHNGSARKQAAHVLSLIEQMFSS